MPIYEYQCPQCRAVVETMQRLQDPPPDCGACGVTMQRILSRTGGIVMKAPAASHGTCCGQSVARCDTPGHCCSGH